jgi:hypothetical protein
VGITHPLKTGDIIGIKHGEKKARFKVVWVTDGGSLRKIEAVGRVPSTVRFTSGCSRAS